jgi:predicted kinase
MATLYILCGPSGCGKSTWAEKFMCENEDIRYVSRDDIRYSILKEDEDYFAHEKEVFKKFAGTITETLIDGFDVIADATHLNEFSRRKLTQAIDMRGYKEYEIIYVVFNTDAETCIERNKAREGRRNVPENIIRNMCRDFRAPTMDEDERVFGIIEVGE